MRIPWLSNLLAKWLNRRRAVATAASQFRAHYPDRRFTCAFVSDTRDDAYVITVWYERSKPPMRSWWLVAFGSDIATEIPAPEGTLEML